MTTTILVVDDDPVAVRMLVEALRSGGYEVLHSYRAKDALRKIKLRKPDLVLTDLDMPEMTGIELISMIREDPDIGQTPVIAVTSFAWDAMGQAAAQLGSDGNIAKPFAPNHLLEKVRECLASGHVAPEPRSPRAAASSKPVDVPEMIRQAITANATAGRGIAVEAPPSIFDKATFLEYVDDNVDHAQRTIDVLLRTLPDRLAAIRQAVASKDSGALRSTAHSLKGSLAFFAAPVVVAAAFRLEMIGHSGDLADASAQYFELERAIVPLVAALQDFVREVRDAPTSNPLGAASAPRHNLHLVGEHQ